MCPLSTKNNYRSQHIDKAHSNTVTHKLTENYKQLECVAKAQRDGRPAVELIETQVLLIQLWTTAS